MKYPPVCSAHWEGPIGQWLRAQLDARGIDALAYGRYVLSLLTRPLDPADLSPSPIGNKNWERRNQSDWAPVKIEALKRSAAVQCLLNACDDQGSGIEELVDELCSKLKQVEEASNKTVKREPQLTKPSRKERSRPLSPREMARLYYAAFPALVPSSSTSETNTSIQSTSVNNSGFISNNQKTKNITSHKHNFGSKEFSRPKKLQISKERHGSATTFRNHSHGNHRQKKSRKACCRTEELPEWVNDGDVWDIESQEHMQEFIRGVDEGYGTCDNTVIDEVTSSKRLYERDTGTFLNIEGDELMFNKNWNEKDLKSLTKSPSEDESIAKFKAKFDRSLEALWPKEQNNNEYETSVEYQDLSSPSDRMFDCYSADKTLPLSLTSSIWSNNDSKSDWEMNDFGVLNNNLNTQMVVSDTVDPNSASLRKDKSWINNDIYNKETMEVIYNKLKPLNLDDPEETIDINTNINTNSTFSKWSDDLSKEPYLFSFKIHQPPIGTPARNLNILNHDSLYSSFTEVVPKAPSGYIGDSFVRKNNMNLKLDLAKSFNTEENEKEDEDLLTSMRTHFKPIKQETTECAQANVKYADGMTFPVVSDLDCVKFSRSNSGNIFLESDNEPPTQYMEYRKQGIDYARLDISSSSFCSDDSLSAKDLILKFKVCQTEKSIQTDNLEVTQVSNSSKEKLNSYISDMQKLSNFSMTNKSNNKPSNNLDTDKELESLDLNWVRCDECKSNHNQWNADDWNSFKLDSSRIWSSDDTFCKTCTEQQAKTEVKQARKDKIYEEETAREWDELLSDLRYIHDCKTGVDWKEEINTPIENCYIAPTEVSINAADGNFIKSALLAKHNLESEKWMGSIDGKDDSNIVGKILDHSLIMYSNVEPHCEACIEDTIDVDDVTVGWRADRKRRHSAVSSGRTKGVGKLRCTLTGQEAIYSSRPLHMPLLPTADRPLTR